MTISIHRNVARTRIFPATRPGFVGAVRAHLAGLADAYARRRTYEAVQEDVGRDVGLSREEIAGESAWQPDLPFFLQSGFGRRLD